MDKWGITRLGSSRIIATKRTQKAIEAEARKMDKQGIETTILKYDEEYGWEVWA